MAPMQGVCDLECEGSVVVGSGRERLDVDVDVDGRWSGWGRWSVVLREGGQAS